MNNTATQLPGEGKRKRSWESPQLILLALDQETQGNPDCLFEDPSGIAYS